ncbi:MAG: SPOR domain-containing protein [Gammaproteobacteria bacterium]|nr:SPOR domain-containing protein [Gammaproteobacteria bacterium]MDH3508285.1 SPOR domain-containing protein [Gammaproteobacteria bacterium]
MDRGLKERLVGAAVLVAIGAWLIPWVLDGPEQISQPAATALDLPVPSAENPPIRTETVVLDRRESPAASALPATPAASATAASREDSRTTTSSRPASTPAPTAEPETPSVERAAANESEWYIQIGAFGDQDNAERQAARVSTFGFDAHVSAFPARGGVVHRVRIGPQSTRERAEAVASSLSAHGFVAQVVFE